jgi:hypothetical protein
LLKRTKRDGGLWPGVSSFIHTGHIADLPAYYGVEWVRLAGWNEPGLPLRPWEKPDPKKHELEFRDKCGEVEKSL